MGEYVDRICLRHILAVNVWVYCVRAAQFIICVYIRQRLWFSVYFRLFSYFYCNEIFKDLGDLFNRSSEGSSRLRVRSVLAYPTAGQS